MNEKGRDRRKLKSVRDEWRIEVKGDEGTNENVFMIILIIQSWLYYSGLLYFSSSLLSLTLYWHTDVEQLTANYLKCQKKDKT